MAVVGGIFFKVVLPTMVPAIAAVSIFLFTRQWNNFLWPLITITTEDKYTLPVALATLTGLQSIDYGVLMMVQPYLYYPFSSPFYFYKDSLLLASLEVLLKECCSLEIYMDHVKRITIQSMHLSL
ncbi:carbohydrate ABC transporter permease [Gracilibacillus oryzae]|uniref:Carbohydrate ABC transporter permease n=2 Tax=Gracilibacillus oryzae TaxID=1672701 RepID=A0A7C8GW58_9BACI|nr:carbohydrate ABC transporter permease [Gracilibacillus oryzae]